MGVTWSALKTRFPILLALVLVALMTAGPSSQVGAQVDPPKPPSEVPVVGELVNEAWGTLAPLLENETGQDLQQEEIDLDLLIEIRNADYDLLGIIFGGGKVDVDVKAHLRLEFRAISIQRIDDALQNATGDAKLGLNSTFGVDSSRMVLTAEELRLAGGGVVLQAFQGLQERAATRALEDLLPGITVLQADFQWSNVLPGQYVREGDPPDLREPPLVLDAAVTLRYLERFSLLEILEMAQEEEPVEDPEKELKRRIEENQTLPPEQRSAFMFLGYGQLMSVELPHGWKLNLTLTVPKGFTIEDASSEFVVQSDKRSTTYFLDGSQRLEPFSTAGVVIVTNRFLVTTTVAMIALIAGVVLRVLVEGGVAGAQAASLRSRKRADKSDGDPEKGAGPTDGQ
jgi:hypothetical protein